MNKIFSSLYVALLSGITLIVLVIISIRYGSGRNDQEAPILVCPSQIALGDCEAGSYAVFTFPVENKGNQTLKITDITESCSCAVLEMEVQPGIISRMKEFSIEPKSAVQITLRQAINWDQGKPFHGTIHFRTNDPLNPSFDLHIHGTPVRGMLAFPKAYTFGQVVQGTPLRQIIQLRDFSTNHRKIQSAISSDPNRIRIKPIDIPINTRSNSSHFVDSTVTCCYEIDVDSNNTGSIRGTIYFIPESTGPVTSIDVQVAGDILAPLEISPRMISLPKKSSDGFVYDATTTIISSNKKLFDVEVSHCPKYLKVELSDNTDKIEQLITVKLLKEEYANLHTKPTESTVQFIAQHDGRRIPLSLRVIHP